MNKLNKFAKLTCQLTHCKDKAKYFVPSFSHYICGGCKQTKFFDEEVIFLSDPEEVKKALQYVEYSIHSVNVCMMQEPKLKNKWRALLESLEAFKHRYGQSKVAFDNIIKNQQWPKLSKVLDELNSIQTDWKASEIFCEFLHYERQESVRLKCKGVIVQSLTMQENVILKAQIDTLQRDKVILEQKLYKQNCCAHCSEGCHYSCKRRSSQSLEASDTEVTDLKNSNTELETTLSNCQCEKAQYLEQFETLKDHCEELKDLATNSRKIAENIGDKVDKMQEAQNHVQTTKDFKLPKENPKSVEGRNKELKGSADLLSRLRFDEGIASEALKDPRFNQYLDNILKSKTFSCSLGNVNHGKLFSLLTKQSSQLLEKVEFWGIGRVDAASANLFLQTCIPSSLQTLSLNFYNGTSNSSITPYLASVLALMTKVTSKLTLYKVKIKKSEKKMIDQAFGAVEVEYDCKVFYQKLDISLVLILG
ncbi:unnamed protein product [Moneuplotes crassus]|uniref:Uncharacterized protein n=1 Tax=Euplotes crassus TaxID=5936 RepID=A0AAD1XLM9_EUPCR|nr:unnamed protein product [Moneuplotes crassus]